MSDILLGDDHRIKLENFDLVLTSGSQAIAQRVKQRLLLFLGEWFLDETEGVPYLQRVLTKGENQDAIRQLFIREVAETEGIEEIEQLDFTVNNESRIGSVSFIATTTTGDTIEVTAEATP